MIINGQLDIKLWQFMEEELDTVLKKDNRKAAGLGRNTAWSFEEKKSWRSLLKKRLEK